MPVPTPDDVRIAVDRALARLPAEAAAEAPRALAVALALQEGISAEEALARCGVDVPPGRPAAAAFVLLPPGTLFWWQGVRYRKVTARASRQLVPGAPNAFPVDPGSGPGQARDGAWFAPDQRVFRVVTGRRAA